MRPTDVPVNNTESNESVAAVEPLNQQQAVASLSSISMPVELGGREGPEPTRFGDWEKAGRCIDF